MALRLRFPLPERTWLSLTPEPERELPAALATLRAGGAPDQGAIAQERDRVQRLVLHGTQRRWLAYLREAIDLATRHAAAGEPVAVARARAIAVEVLHNHHALLLGLPGRAAEQTQAERARLAAAALDLGPAQEVDTTSDGRGHLVTDSPEARHRLGLARLDPRPFWPRRLFSDRTLTRNGDR